MPCTDAKLPKRVAAWRTASPPARAPQPAPDPPAEACTRTRMPPPPYLCKHEDQVAQAGEEKSHAGPHRALLPCRQECNSTLARRRSPSPAPLAGKRAIIPHGKATAGVLRLGGRLVGWWDSSVCGKAPLPRFGLSFARRGSFPAERRKGQVCRGPPLPLQKKLLGGDFERGGGGLFWLFDVMQFYALLFFLFFAAGWSRWLLLRAASSALQTRPAGTSAYLLRSRRSETQPPSKPSNAGRSRNAHHLSGEGEGERGRERARPLPGAQRSCPSLLARSLARSLLPLNPPPAPDTHPPRRERPPKLRSLGKGQRFSFLPGRTSARTRPSAARSGSLSAQPHGPAAFHPPRARIDPLLQGGARPPHPAPPAPHGGGRHRSKTENAPNAQRSAMQCGRAGERLRGARADKPSAGGGVWGRGRTRRRRKGRLGGSGAAVGANSAGEGAREQLSPLQSATPRPGRRMWLGVGWGWGVPSLDSLPLPAQAPPPRQPPASPSTTSQPASGARGAPAICTRASRAPHCKTGGRPPPPGRQSRAHGRSPRARAQGGAGRGEQPRSPGAGGGSPPLQRRPPPPPALSPSPGWLARSLCGTGEGGLGGGGGSASAQIPGGAPPRSPPPALVPPHTFHPTPRRQEGGGLWPGWRGGQGATSPRAGADSGREGVGVGGDRPPGRPSRSAGNRDPLPRGGSARVRALRFFSWRLQGGGAWRRWGREGSPPGAAGGTRASSARAVEGRLAPREGRSGAIGGWHAALPRAGAGAMEGNYRLPLEAPLSPPPWNWKRAAYGPRFGPLPSLACRNAALPCWGTRPSGWSSENDTAFQGV